MNCTRRIVLLTSRAAEPVVRHYASQSNCVDVEVLPVNVASFLTAEELERIVSSTPRLLEKLRDADLVIAPGLVKGDLSPLSTKLGVKIVKGTRSATGIPALLKHIHSGGELSAVEPADAYLEGRARPLRGVSTVRVGPVEVPLRGPPTLIAAEIPPGRPVRGEASRLAREGAELIVVGVSQEDEPEAAGERIAGALEDLKGMNVAVLAEAPTPQHGEAALSAGADGLVAVPQVAASLARLLRGRAALIADRDVDTLFIVAESLSAMKVSVLVDPVLDLPLIGLARSIARYVEASERLPVPLVFSAANASTEVEADTHGVHALLAAIAVELGASIYYVVEDRYKDLHSTSEALEALRLAERALETGLGEKGLYSRLLIVKQGDPPPPPRLPPGESVGRIPPRLDRSGYFLVDVDHSRGVIVVEFRGRAGKVRLEGREALSLARAMLRRISVDIEHAAYLGYELCKAELALKLGKTYIQDEDLLSTPWEAQGS